MSESVIFWTSILMSVDPAGVGMIRSRWLAILMSPPLARLIFPKLTERPSSSTVRPLLSRHAELALVDDLDHRMLECNGKVIQPDVHCRIATDAKQVVVDPQRADDLPPFRAVTDLAKQKRHVGSPRLPVEENADDVRGERSNQRKSDGHMDKEPDL
jgi:hypothetical protein